MNSIYLISTTVLLVLGLLYLKKIIIFKWMTFLSNQAINYSNLKLSDINLYVKSWEEWLSHNSYIFVESEYIDKAVKLRKKVLETKSNRLDIEIPKMKMKDKGFILLQEKLLDNGYIVKIRKTPKLRKINQLVIPIETSNPFFIQEIMNALKIVFEPNIESNSFTITCYGEFQPLKNPNTEFLPNTKSSLIGFKMGLTVKRIRDLINGQ
ncbi:hypothetical protein OAA91_01945 [Fibrobacterales bacterium]|nr:hypothetical protein [Fibrobacterales bacterium]